MQIRMSAGDALPRRAWTEGLEAPGQQELAVTLPWPEGDARDAQIIRLLRFIEGYVASQPRRILTGQKMNYGWSTLRFVADEERNKLLIEELSNRHTSGETAYVAGATRAVALVALQEEVLRRLHITGESEHPRRSSTAIVCNRVTPETIGSLRPLQVQRLWEPDSHASGWFVGCVGGGHDHDNADQLEQVHLVAGLPGLFPYLALPVGTALLFEAEQVIVFRPGEQEGHPDAAPLLWELP